MDITIIAIGKMKNGPERELISRYIERSIKSGKQLGLTGFKVIELSESQRSSALERKADEAKAINKHIPTKANIIVLDEKGKSIGSVAFAKLISNWRDDAIANLFFIIGGADGLDKSIIKSANISIGFSALTWPHQLVRIMLAEQLYRSTTIISNHPYHRS